MLCAVKFESSLRPVHSFPNLENAWPSWASCRTSKGRELHSQGHAQETESTSASLRSLETPDWHMWVNSLQWDFMIYDSLSPHLPQPPLSKSIVPSDGAPCSDPHWWEGLPGPRSQVSLSSAWDDLCPDSAGVQEAQGSAPAHGCLVLAILCPKTGSALRSGF